MRPRLCCLYSILLAVILVGAGYQARAAQGDEAYGSFLIRSWQSEDGLPSGIVRSVAQGGEGYLWVATAEGVVRFDGVRFSGFSGEGEEALAALPPRTLFPFPNGEMWIATLRGGLLRWRNHRLETVLKDADASVPTGQIAAVTQVVAEGENAYLISKGSDVLRIVGHGPPQAIARTEALDAALAEDAEAWVQHGRVYSLSASAQLRDHAGRTWSVRAGGGVSVTDSSGHSESLIVPKLEPGSRVGEMCEDREGNIWFATGESGLVQIRPRNVDVLRPSHGLGDRTALALLEDRSGALWVGAKGGVDRIIEGHVTHFEVGDPGAGRPVSVLCELRDGTLWAATRSGSTFHWQGDGFKPAFSKSIAPGKVAAIVEDQAGNIWLGGEQGLAVLSEGQLTRLNENEGLGDIEISALAVDAANSLWVGASNGQIFRGKDRAFSQVGTGKISGERPISSILADTDGSVWFTTVGSGLVHLSCTGSVARFGAEQGLPDSRLTAVLDDGAGNLWLGSLAGIFRVSRDSLAQIESGRAKTMTVLQLGRADGLLSRECTGYVQPSAWRSRTGQLWFPTINGVAHLQPDRLLLNPLPPPVVVEEVRANGTASNLKGGVFQAGPGRSRLEFRFTGLSFAAPEKVKFALRLENLENDWRDADGQRSVVYDSVPPGRYRFHVIAANGDGVWNRTGASVTVEVLPHFWETAWFQIGAGCAAVAVAALVGWGIARSRMRQRLIRAELQNVREVERTRIAQDLHDDLGASLTEISLLAQLAVEDSPADPESRDALPEIAAKAQALVGALDEIVWAVNPRHDTLRSVADYLAAFAAEFLETAGISLRLEFPRDVPSIALDAERRHSLFLAVRESLNNIVKHAAATEVLLCMEVVDGCLEVAIEDNGRGFRAGQGSSGDGMGNLRARLARVGGECRIDSREGHGTKVQLLVPVEEGASVKPPDPAPLQTVAPGVPVA